MSRRERAIWLARFGQHAATATYVGSIEKDLSRKNLDIYFFFFILDGLIALAPRDGGLAASTFSLANLMVAVSEDTPFLKLLVAEDGAVVAKQEKEHLKPAGFSQAGAAKRRRGDQLKAGLRGCSRAELFPRVTLFLQQQMPVVKQPWDVILCLSSV